MASAVIVSVSLRDLTVREAGSHIVSGLRKRPHGKEMTFSGQPWKARGSKNQMNELGSKSSQLNPEMKQF